METTFTWVKSDGSTGTRTFADHEEITITGEIVVHMLGPGTIPGWFAAENEGPWGWTSTEFEVSQLPRELFEDLADDAMPQVVLPDPPPAEEPPA